MDQSLVSVIVPVYNAESTVESCIQSILSQTWTALEVLAVDDGSADGSLEALKKMAADDPRLIVLHQPNGGVASARNLGIARASGKYLQFVDSDDVLAPDATERMALAMDHADCELVIAPYIEVAGDFHNIKGKRGFIRENRSMTQREFLHRMSLHPNSFYYAVLWNKLYRRELVEKNAVRCDGRFPWGEDFEFNTRYFQAVLSVEALSEPVYYYHRRACGLALDSVRQCVTHPARSLRVKWELQKSYERLFREAELYEEYRHVLKRYLFGVTISG